MIAEIRFKNMFSFRDEAILSFEADRSKDMESYHIVELGGDVRLLKVAVIYGANASGKSNIIKVCDFIKSFITYTPLNNTDRSVNYNKNAFINAEQIHDKFRQI